MVPCRGISFVKEVHEARTNPFLPEKKPSELRGSHIHLFQFHLIKTGQCWPWEIQALPTPIITLERFCPIKSQVFTSHSEFTSYLWFAYDCVLLFEIQQACANRKVMKWYIPMKVSRPFWQIVLWNWSRFDQNWCRICSNTSPSKQMSRGIRRHSGQIRYMIYVQ